MSCPALLCCSSFLSSMAQSLSPENAGRHNNKVRGFTAAQQHKETRLVSQAQTSRIRISQMWTTDGVCYWRCCHRFCLMEQRPVEIVVLLCCALAACFYSLCEATCIKKFGLAVASCTAEITREKWRRKQTSFQGQPIRPSV